MISVFANWAIIAITSYVLGYGFLWLVGKVMPGAKNVRPIGISFAGLCIANVYAEVWSLFGGVNIAAEIVLIVIFAVVFLACRKSLAKHLREDLFGKISPGLWAVYFAITVLAAYGTSRGYMHVDTGLYHAQAIRWIEEYGVVPGLANLHTRFGYNSAEFALNALYGFKWLFGQPMHTLSGFFALLSAFLLVDYRRIIGRGVTNNRKIVLKPSDFVRLGLFFYLCTIYGEMISPASDYYAQLLIFDVVIMWLDLREDENAECHDSVKVKSYDDMTDKYALLCILLVYAVTIKLSIGLLILFTIKPAIAFLKSKNYAKIWTSIICGAVIALPYFIRNHIISGWILYPSTALSIGHPDYQLLKGVAQYDAKEIGMWGRGITEADLWDSVTATNWIADWFMALTVIEKLWIVLTVLAIICGAVYFAISILRQKADCEFGLVYSVMAVGTIFWFVSAPLVRYGYAYLIIVPCFVFGYLLCKTNIAQYAFIICALSVIVLKGKGLISDIITTVSEPYYALQKDYIDGDAYTYEVDGVTIYVPTEFGQIGYYKFPSSPTENEHFSLRTDDIKDGFVYE